MTNDLITYLSFGLLALLVIGSLTWLNNDVSVQTQTVDVSKLATKADVEALTNKVDAIPTTPAVYTDKDDIWEDEALALATNEWSRNNYREIFKALENIDDKEDISKIVVKDNDVTEIDEDDKDAVVVQELKVYFEDLNGDNVKAYLTVTSIIKDGEVESQEFELL